MRNPFLALNVQLPATAPEWIELIPAGPVVAGRDGRKWHFHVEDNMAVRDAFRLGGVPLPIDWEHATEIKGPQGEEAPAAGWIVSLSDRDGALWGRVEWTERGSDQIAAREYRFLSPVFSYTKEGRAIRALESAGLTNKPNLRLAALNRQAPTMEEDAMKKALCRLLGLPETATDQEIQDAIATLKGDLDMASNRSMTQELLSALGLDENAGADQAVARIKALNNAKASVDLARFVPRDDYDLAVNRAEKAEKDLKQREAADLEEKIETAVNAAIQSGKIAPASKDFYVSTCRKDGGLDEFVEFVDAAPQVIAEPVLPDSPGDEGRALNREEAVVAEMFGNTAEDLEKYAK